MTLSNWAIEIHKNAIAHGWWDEPRDDAEIISLIHSEWSEALEEYRAGRPMVWHECTYPHGKATIVCVTQDSNECPYAGMPQLCKLIGDKPEGIAVELIDGCIRILDYLSSKDWQYGYEYTMINARTGAIPLLICDLHMLTAASIAVPGRLQRLVMAINLVFAWIREQGLDPEQIMRKKHEYNKTRPYRHGGKKC